VLSALNGHAAQSVIEPERPDLIVTDWMMPGVDGVALCRWLNADAATAAIPVVMRSAAHPLCRKTAVGGGCVLDACENALRLGLTVQDFDAFNDWFYGHVDVT
jgi:CheY-like chemotaxis protein